MAKRSIRHPPKAVEFRFTEKLPKRPPDRPSRLVRGTPLARARLEVERILCAHHGASDAAIRRLGEPARTVLLRIATDPADRDHVYRREAVSALAALDSREAAVRLAALATDAREDPVIAARALRALARVGGEAAARLLERSLEGHPDPYVRTSALKALLTLKHRSSVPALVRISQEHPSAIMRARVRERLAEMGVAVPGRRVRIRNTGVLRRERRR